MLPLELNSSDAILMLEQNVLGAILQDPTLMDEARSYLSRDMFTHPYHRNLFRMMVILHEKRMSIDPITIVNQFKKYMPRVGGATYLMQLHGNTLGLPHFSDYVQRLVEGQAKKKLLQLMVEYRARFENQAEMTFEELLDEFEREVWAVRPVKKHKNARINDLTTWFERLVQKKQDHTLAYGIMTGWTELDRMTLGWQKTDLIVVGARTSMGKSAFAIEVALRASRRGHKVAIFSLEMTKEQVYNRMMTNLAKIPLQAMRVGAISDGQLEAISACLGEIAKIHVDDERGVTAEYITSEMRRLKRQEGLDLVIIDYLQEIKEPAERNDHTGSALHRICQKIRQAAKDCDCAVIGLSQVKREVETRNDKRARTSDLSGSAAIEAVADTIILLYRDEYYNPDTPDKGVLEVNVAKQRNGPTGLIRMYYDKDYQRITGKGDEMYAN